MKIAIELNDVIRDYSRNFVKYYHQYYDHTFDITESEVWTNDMRALLPFKSDNAYERFTYEKYVYEIFGRCDTCHSQTGPDFKYWLDNVVPNIDTDEPIEVMIVSSMEYGLSIGATMFFISKLNVPVREYYFPMDSLTIWDKCDVLITANPRLLENKPEGKKSIKIEMEYNKECAADYTYGTFREFTKKENNTTKLLDK